jgi:hypothetical protein
LAETVKDGDQLRVMFPQFWRIDSMARGELSGLNDSELDWTSDKYGWAGWSMRQQASHMASLVFRWLCIRWGEALFPGGSPVSREELLQLSSTKHDRRLNDRVYHEMDNIIAANDRAIELARSVLKARTVADGRSLTVPRSVSAQWALMAKAHPNGVTVDASGGGSLTLEATFRHMYFEHVTHLYNVQRIKRALGMPVIVKLPDDGYHMLMEWDRSEAEPGSEMA